MKRREVLIKSTWLLRATVFAPAIVPLIQSCDKGKINRHELRVLSEDQNDLIKAISDSILPKTETASASEAKVNTYLDKVLGDVFNQNETKRFLQGLDQFDISCEETMGKSFLNLNIDAQNDYLKDIDGEIMSVKYADEVPFYFAFKTLITTIYFSSEEGVKQNLNYDPIPGSYQGDIPYQPGESIRRGNNM